MIILMLKTPEEEMEMPGRYSSTSPRSQGRPCNFLVPSIVW